MKFFDREKETKLLHEIENLSYKYAQFTILTGRRRVGKTWLVTHAYNQAQMLYFFVARKSEADLCKGFTKEISEKLGIPMLGTPENFADIFEFIMQYAIHHHVTLFIDEFQDLAKINKSIFSDMQRIWDLHKEDAKINLIVGGSLYSLLSKIFKDSKEPLYGRQSRFLHIRPFRTDVLKKIIQTYNPEYTSDDLLTLYMLTGGVAKYVSTLMDSNAVTSDAMFRRILSEDSPYISEGRVVLYEEFGKESGVYFSILSAIASGRNTRNEIETFVGKELGGHLSRLEEDYNLVSKHIPFPSIGSKTNVHYDIDDAFFLFWFRFIHKYNYMIEIGKYDNLREVVARDYNTFSGICLERYFRKKLIEEKDITRIGAWWDRKGENEIDIITENELHKTLSFYEVKRNADNIRLGLLKKKAETFFLKNPKFASEYSHEYIGLSLDDM